MKVEKIGNQTLILGDCLAVMPTLGRFDAVVTDPPYGIGEASDVARGSRTPVPGRTRLNTKSRVVEYEASDWDDKTADAEVALARSLAKWSIIFGGNYYDLPPTSCWLIWDKLNSGDFADCEMAWTNLNKAVRRLQFHWNGCMRRERHIPRQHPTQKPLGVMEWCLGFLPDAKTILDPFMGSGTTLVACQRLGRHGTGIELDPDYFAVACKRVDEAARQPDLLIPETRQPPVQEQLL